MKSYKNEQATGSNG